MTEIKVRAGDTTVLYGALIRVQSIDDAFNVTLEVESYGEIQDQLFLTLAERQRYCDQVEKLTYENARLRAKLEKHRCEKIREKRDACQRDMTNGLAGAVAEITIGGPGDPFQNAQAWEEPSRPESAWWETPLNTQCVQCRRYIGRAGLCSDCKRKAGQ